ncbi:L-threonylcarbamoyladenylate synthase [Blattabacterium cuenoti]|uniref:L-threonylcarbamoyladenylate synthase n=1 Tax=Blattabacterium cuenoti TaxID=1653831 RepID=UPI00163D2698|nr:L-threonylcarbamoyladenylate synthase [Blattabacterium cuenoti]
MYFKFKNELYNSIDVLMQGKIILYPTDTVWGIGCDAFNLNSIENIYRIKKRDKYKPMILLVDSINRLQNIVGPISDFIKKIVIYDCKKNKKPITVIYDKIYKSNVISKYSRVNWNNELAVRLTYDLFCINLIKKLNRPIISTSANLSGYVTPRSFSEINKRILKKVDYIVNLRRNEKSIFYESTILKIVSNKIKVIRK